MELRYRRRCIDDHRCRGGGMAELSRSDTAGPGIREYVRERYAAAARIAAADAPSSCCGSAASATTDSTGNQVFGAALYDADEAAGAPRAAVAASLGCGVPTAVAELREGETVLDLGSGAGADVLIAARRVGPGGRAIGLDMTEEMLALARENATQAGAGNVEFLRGHIEDIPLPDASVDVVISNCVINLSADKARVLREAARVLRPGGRLAVSDVIADADMDADTRADMAAWTGCIAGALTRDEFAATLTGAGLVDVEIRETHRVHAHAASAIIRASRPSSEVCCDPAAAAACCEPAAKAACCGSGPAAPALTAPAVPESCGCRA
jgi:SAM-dependent methyltransferase